MAIPKEPPPAPGPKQQARIAKARAGFERRDARYSVFAEHEGPNVNARIAAPHSDEEGHKLHNLDVFGTTSVEFAAAMLGELGAVVAVRRGTLDELTTNAAFAIVEAVDAENEIEGALAVQMAATHNVAMDMLRRAKFAEIVPALQEYGTLATKMLRAFNIQVEVLAKLRRGGAQKVIVEHVHVYRGGQAIVGSVEQFQGTGGRGWPKTVINPMNNPLHLQLAMLQAPRCLARNRQGKPCQSPAIKGKRRCRLHGGAQGSGAPCGHRNGNYRHGRRTKEHIAMMRAARALCRPLADRDLRRSRFGANCRRHKEAAG